MLVATVIRYVVESGVKVRRVNATYNLLEDTLQENLHNRRRVGKDRLHDLCLIIDRRPNLLEQDSQSGFRCRRRSIWIADRAPSKVSMLVRVGSHLSLCLSHILQQLVFRDEKVELVDITLDTRGATIEVL